MSTRQLLTQISLGLGFAITLINPAFSQITPNGAGTVVTSQGNQINITGGTQAGGNLFHSFRDFNVNSSQIANFLSNPQIQNILARVNGGNPSMINGLLQVTGGNSNLFLMNPAGIIFGQGASLNIPASFTATTANQIGLGNNQYFSAVGNNNYADLIGNPDSFLFTTNQAGSIVNAGNLSVIPGQGINLIGGNIVNTGNINAENITLAAVPGTNRVRISQPGHLLSLEIIPPVDSVITPLDLPRLLTGSDLPGINTNGEIVQVAGVNIPTGQGINITSGNLSTFSQGGIINILGDRIALLNANINASGSNGGGTIRVGGEYQGGGNNPFNSRITYVDTNSFLNADAVNSGNGGRVIVWADDTTRFYGNISGRGVTGSGGFVEVSGKVNLAFDGRVEIPGANGLFGTLLLDPADIIIQAAVGNGDGSLPNIALGTLPDPMTISAGALAAIAPTTTVDIQASNNIMFNVPVTFAPCIAGTCGGISFTAGGAFNTNGNDITASGRDFRVTAGSITARDINTSSSTTLRDGGRVNLFTNNGSITTRDINTGSSVVGAATGNGGRIDLNAFNGNISAREISSGVGTNSGNAGLGGNILISAPNGNIDVAGNIDSRSVVQGTGNSSTAGDITITAQDINVGTLSDPLTGAIAAYSRVGTGVSGNGGNITVRATNGDITARGINTTAGAVLGTAGNAGNINIDAINNITLLGATINEISPIDVFALDSRSVSLGGGDAGRGGNIRINQNLVSNGIFRANGEIDSSSFPGFGGYVSNTGGDISISTNGDINTRDISSYSSFDNGGAINLNAGGSITTGRVNSGTNTGNGGAINLTANDGEINSTGNLTSSSYQGQNGAINLRATGNINTLNLDSSNEYSGRSGDIILFTGGNINSGNIIATSSFSPASLGDSGNIVLNARGSIRTGNIDSSSFAGNSGAINLTSGIDILTSNLNSSNLSKNGNGGAITLNANRNISTNDILAYGLLGGIINLSASGSINSLQIDGAINNLLAGEDIRTLEIVGSVNLAARRNINTERIFYRGLQPIFNINAGNTVNIGGIQTDGGGGVININAGSNIISRGEILIENGNEEVINLIAGSNISVLFLSTQNSFLGGAGGSINIVAGNTFLATGNFTARDSTLASISTQGGAGGGAITITHGGSTSVPFLVGSATVNGTAAAITSGTGANTINNLIVPVPPEVNNYGTNISIRTTAPVTTIPTFLIPLLANPTPPPTPTAVVVGTPPASPDPIPQNSSVNNVITPSNNVVAPPIIPVVTATPLLPVAPPLPPDRPPEIIPIISRPGNLDATSPGIQPSISSNTANSNIPIIDRLPTDFLGNNIRLLDQNFKEEFQAFTGIGDEIATLDVNQAQDILNRITKETNVKPAFIYVFFTPANDPNANNRTVNSARTQLFRNPSDTDTLEVVLVPPTGDLVRVRYPGLTRPEVIQSAGELTRGVARRNLIYASASKRMYDLIIAPLEEDLTRLKIDNLVFLMDAGLRSMPIAAMQNKENKFIIEDYSVALMPSLTLTDTTYSSLKDAQVMAMGADRFIDINLKPLPGVPVELKAINQIRGGNIFLNENFTLSNLRQNRRPEQRIVHLATHGSFVGDKANSFIQLWGTERITLEQIRSSGFGTPPVDLLVLSACETALGNRESELGFAGLAVTSGVRSALASLWQVSDEGTMGLMAEFYQQLQTTTTKSEALRQAQLAMLRGEVRLEGGSLVTPKGNFALNEELKRLGDRTLTHPFFWSAFTMIGNPW